MFLQFFILFLSIPYVLGAPIRLIVNGSQLLDPTNDYSPILLKGFDWNAKYIQPEDSEMMKSLIPSVNLIRVVGIFWNNTENALESSNDCQTLNASHGYIKQSCLDKMDTIVNKVIEYNTNNPQNENIWILIMVRAEYAAGQDYPTWPDVFHNETLRQQMYVMWQYVSNYYKNTDYILYEIMSEPRTKIVNQTVVRDFYQGAINAISAVDNLTPLVIGPAPYYKPWMLNESDDFWISNNQNVIYTVDFFIPQNYIQSDGSSGDNYTYPGYYDCSVALPGWTCAGTGHVQPCFCPSNPHEIIYVDKLWLEGLFLNYSLIFEDTFNVPIYVNQWGIQRSVPSINGRYVYTQDILDIFIQFKLHSTYWIWKYTGSGTSWNGYEIIHNFTSNSTVGIDYNMISVFNNTWNDLKN